MRIPGNALIDCTSHDKLRLAEKKPGADVIGPSLLPLLITELKSVRSFIRAVARSFGHRLVLLIRRRWMHTYGMRATSRRQRVQLCLIPATKGAARLRYEDSQSTGE